MFCDLSQCGKVDIEYQELAWQLPSICGITGFPFSLLLAKLGFIVLKILDIQVLMHSLGILWVILGMISQEDIAAFG